MDFLQPQTIARLGAKQFGYPQRFTIAASSNGEPASGGSSPIAIQSGFHFFTEALFLSYPTVKLVEADVVDDGVCRLDLAVSSGQSLPMWKNPARLDLIGVPGRMPVLNALTAGGDTPPPGQAPHIDGFPFKYFLMQGSSFDHVFSNTSDVEAVVNVFWRGWNIPVENCPDFDTFNRIVMACQLPPGVA